MSTSNYYWTYFDPRYHREIKTGQWEEVQSFLDWWGENLREKLCIVYAVDPISQTKSPLGYFGNPVMRDLTV